MKKRSAWILAAAVTAVALGAAAVGLVALVVRGPGGAPAPWSGPAFLALTVDGALDEQPPGEWSSLFESRPPSLRGLVESVDRAARDRHVRGLVLRVGSLAEAGWARVQELRDALVRFRASGKPSWAHLEYTSNKEYYLATGAEKIAATPSAFLDVSGLAAEVTFLRGTLDKLGIEAQFEGVGKYKNAPNQFTETGFTEAHREQTEALVDSLLFHLVAGIAEGRKLERTRVRALIDEGPFDAPRAREAGLVDELLYRDQLESRLGVGERVGAAGYVRAARRLGFDGRPKIALIYAVGDIMPGESQSSPFGGDGFVGADTLGRALREAGRDGSVRAIVLRVDSPGGSAIAADAIWREVGEARRTKPLVVSMGDVAASGGYYIAMNSDAIVAQPGTITGSIGVFSGKLSFRGLFGKLGLRRETVARGRHASLFSSYEPWSEEERALVRRLNESVYDTFVAKAAQGRKKKREEIDAVAQGRVWTGAEALAVGLVDRLGGLDAAVDLAKEKARIGRQEEVLLVVLPERKSLFQTLMERQEEDITVRALAPQARVALRWLSALQGSGPMARLPFEIDVR